MGLYEKVKGCINVLVGRYQKEKSKLLAVLYCTHNLDLSCFS